MDKRLQDYPLVERVVRLFPSKARAARVLGIDSTYMSRIVKKGYFPPHLHYVVLQECGDNVTHKELYETWKSATDEHYNKTNKTE